MPVDYKREVVQYETPKEHVGFRIKNEMLEREVASLTQEREAEKTERGATKTTGDKEVTAQAMELEEKSKTAQVEKKIAEMVGPMIQEMKDDYLLANEPFFQVRGDNNWYRFFALTRERLMEAGIDSEEINEMLIQHMFDSVAFSKKYLLVNFLYGYEGDDMFINKLKEHLESTLLKSKGQTGYIFIRDKTAQLYIVRDGKFVKAESEDVKDFSREIKKLLIAKERYNNIVGFFTEFKAETMVFKTKDVEAKAKRNSGARCDQAGKKPVMDTLNKIFNDEDRYTKENTGRKHNVIQLCGEEEFYLRYFDRTRKDGKRWFLSPEEASVNNIEKFSRS